MPPAKVVLVTGPFGNVGSWVVRHLARQNAALGADSDAHVRVRCFDRDGPVPRRVHERLVSELGEHAFETVWGDLTKRADVERALAGGVDAVVHVGAVIPPFAYQVPDVARRVNVDATQTLLELCAALPAKPRFVFASSYSVHGPRNPAGANNEPLSASTPVNPHCMYARHKVEGERMVRAYAGSWVILRLGAVTPPPPDLVPQPPLDGLMVRFVFSIPSAQHRHAVASSDCGLAFARAATLPEPAVAGRTFMIGGDASWRITSGHFNNVFFKALGVGEISPLAYRVPDASGDDAPWYYEEYMDTAEAQSVLDFQRTPFQDFECELYARTGTLTRAATRLVSPLVRLALCYKSPHYAHAVAGRPDPERNASFASLCPGSE